MPNYTAQFFDDMPDDILKGLHLLAQVAQELAKEDIKLLAQNKDGQLMEPTQHLRFLEQVNAAFERRYGPVTGQ